MRPKATYVALLGSAHVLRHLKIVKSGCQESSSFFPGVYALPGTGTHAWRNISLSIQFSNPVCTQYSYSLSRRPHLVLLCVT